MANYTDQFRSLVEDYLGMDIEFPGLRAATIAQWTLESGYGTSKLATEYLNFGGLKWRSEMEGFATPVDYTAHDGTEKYCKFSSPREFVKGYYHFLDRDPYRGWRSHTGSASDFIHFIGPIYTPTALYADSVLSLLPTAEHLVAELGRPAPPDFGETHGTSEHPPKPAIKQFIQSPNFSSRNGERIRRIIMHYTTSRNVNGTIDHFLNPNSRVSAHYVIGRDGNIFQMVRDGDKAWHAKNANADSIGIEHSAAQGDQMTPAQELSSLALVRWLLSEYRLPKSAIHGHKYTPENAGTTDCPQKLFGEDSEEAINNWVRDKV
jgi:N-acetylmuramoyl-L-alanine amidase/Mannosyl-glycoprotein endo-beta-N-acetylglucosaminidase